MPHLSICIPTYNRSRLLQETLSALCAVRWPFEAEIVVSDNASTDDTPRVLASFPVRSFRQPKNLEAIENYFAVLRAARGEYAFYLADDDMVVPEALARAVAQMQAHPEWVASFSPMLEVQQGTDRVLQTVNQVDAPFALAKGDFSAALRFFMQRVYHPETPLVRSEAFRRFVTRPRKMWYSYWMVGCLLKQGPIGFLSEATFKHRIRPPSEETQLQWSYAVDELDRNRLGLEYIAFLAEKQHGGRLPEDIGSRLADFFIERFTAYAEVAMNVCKLQGDLQGAAEFASRLALWRATDVAAIDKGSLEARVDAEIEKRRASAEGALTVVETASEREALVTKGQDASRIVAREDLRQALSIG